MLNADPHRTLTLHSLPSPQIQALACRAEERDRDWQPVGLSYADKTLFLPYGPNQNVTVSVQIGDSVGLSSILTPAKSK